MPQKSIRDNCLADYAKTLPEKEGKALLARFDAVTGRNISEYQAARDIIIDEHKKLFARLNDIKVKAGEKVAEYQEQSEPDYAGIDNAVKEILTKKIGEVKKKSDARKEEIEKRRVQIENERKARQEEKAKKEAEAAEKKRLIEEKKNEKDEKLAEKKKKIKEIQDSLNISEEAAEKILGIKFKSREMRLAEVDRIKRLDQAKTKLREQTGKEEGKDIGGELGGREFPASDPYITKELEDDIRNIKGFETILRNTIDEHAKMIGDNMLRHELAKSGAKSVGTLKQDIDGNKITAGKDIFDALKRGEMKVTNDTSLFDIVMSNQASEQQKGVALALILADRAMGKDNFLANLTKKTGAKIIIRNKVGAPIMSANENGVISINADALGRRFVEINAESKFFTWAEAALYEEAIHLATFKVANEGEVEQIGRELGDSERAMVRAIYGADMEWQNPDTGKMEPDYYHIGLEYVRMIVQNSINGTVTETFKPKSFASAFFAKMVKYLRDLFGKNTDSIANRVVNRLEVYAGIKKMEAAGKTTEESIANRPKVKEYEKTPEGKPVFRYRYKNREYMFMQGDWLPSGTAWFEVEKTGWGEWLPVGKLTSEDPYNVHGLLGFSFSEATSNLFARDGMGTDDKFREFPASDPLSGKVDDVVINFIDSQLWKEIAKENESDAIVEGDPLRHFEIPTTGDVIVQEAMATQLKRHPEYEPYVDDWIRMQDDMSLADANMRVLVDNIFATNDFDTALSYIIDVLYDRSMDAELPGVRSFLVNAVIDKLKYTNPLQAHMIMERIYGGQAGIAHSAYRMFGGLRSWTDVSAKEESQLPYELRMQMNEFFSHGAAKKDVMNILGSVKGGKEIEDAIKKVQEANRRTKLTKEENEILAAMADDAQERLDYAMEDVQKVISEISKGERKMQKITANEKKLAKERAGKVSYKMMARRQAETMEQVFTKIKQTLSDVAKKCK